MLDRRFLTVIRQRYDFSCGSAALATLLRYHYGVRATEESVFLGMWAKGDRELIQKQGFSLLDMKRLLSEQGLESAGYKVSLEEIEAAGVPGIALITVNGYRHFVVIKGMQGDRVLIGDPSRGLHVESRKSFEKVWDGLLFVIVDELDRGKAGFNRVAQWNAVVAAPYDTAAAQPSSHQALSLTTPFLPQEF